MCEDEMTGILMRQYVEVTEIDSRMSDDTIQEYNGDMWGVTTAPYKATDNDGSRCRHYEGDGPMITKNTIPMCWNKGKFPRAFGLRIESGSLEYKDKKGDWGPLWNEGTRSKDLTEGKKGWN